MNSNSQSKHLWLSANTFYNEVGNFHVSCTDFWIDTLRKEAISLPYQGVLNETAKWRECQVFWKLSGSLVCGLMFPFLWVCENKHLETWIITHKTNKTKTGRWVDSSIHSTSCEKRTFFRLSWLLAILVLVSPKGKKMYTSLSKRRCNWTALMTFRGDLIESLELPEA